MQGNGIDVSDRQGFENPGRLHFQLRKNPEYRRRFADRVHAYFFNDGPLTPQNNIERYMRIADDIDKAVVAESARWGDSKSAQPFTRDVHWIRERDRIVGSFFPARTEITLRQMVRDLLYPDIDAPEYQVNGIRQHGGQVTPADDISILADAGTIYYTLNGSDPRIGNVENKSDIFVNENSAARALVPTDDSLASAWQLPGFDDFDWIAGTSSVGFDRGSDYAGLVGLDLLSGDLPVNRRMDTNNDGTNENNSVFVRIPFHVDDPSSIESLNLDMIYDDGFVAYFNGNEIARENVPQVVTWNSAAVEQRGDAGQVMIAITYDANNQITIYRDGELYSSPGEATKGSLQTYRSGAASILFGLRHQDIAGQTGSPMGNDPFFAGAINEARIYNTDLALAEIQAIFSDGPVVGEEPIPQDDRLKHLWTFNVDTKDLKGRAHGSLRGGAALDTGRLVLDGIDDYMNTASINNTISERTLVTWVGLDNLQQRSGSVMTLQNPNGTDVFDAIVYAERAERQWMAGSNGFTRTVANNGGRPETVVAGSTLVPASFDVSAHVEKLIAGQNVLAIQALSNNPTTENMLISPTLIANQTKGGLSREAVRYTEPINIDGTTQVNSRVLIDGQWSALSQAVFEIPVNGLDITEIMFHPLEPFQPSDWTDSDFEFIELHNHGANTIQLSALRFTDGIDFDFSHGDISSLSPDQFVLIVSNREAFASRYGADLPIAGEFTGLLSNRGETIQLSDRFGNVIHEFRYDDDWFSHTDGLGFSLIRRDQNQGSDLSDRLSWRPSNLSGGSPGQRDTALEPGSIVINEVLATSSGEQNLNGIELFNTTDRTIDIGHWLISDSIDNLRKYRFPAGTILPAASYITLTEADHFGPSALDNGRITPFRLSRDGGEIFLSAGDASNAILGYRETQAYGSAESGVSLGRFKTKSGTTEFVRLVSPTFGAPNAAPLVGPLVINELMYHPAFMDSEFIEVYNASSQPIPLDDRNGWRISGAINFEFSSNHTVPKNGYVVFMQGVAGVEESVSAHAFRARQNVPDDVEIFVYNNADHGSLSNGGETIYLEKARGEGDASESDYIVVDAVQYDDSAPWPELADGHGTSISKVHAESYGNDVTNWRSGTLGGTPGRSNLFIDTTPPEIPQNLNGRIDLNGKVRLGWNVGIDTDSDVVRYHVYRDGEFIATTVVPTFADTVEFANKPFAYQVAAVNVDGFESKRSNTSKLFGQSLTLRDGLNGYSGTQDATIFESQPNASNGGDAQRIEIDGSTGASDKWGLIRWDISDLPEDAFLLGASITVHVEDGTTRGSYGMYRLKREWVENEVSWNEASNGDPWDTPGVFGNLDRGTEILATWELGRGIHTVDLNEAGVQVIADWANGTSPNFGFFFWDATTTDGLDFSSRETADEHLRPALTLVYETNTEAPLAGDFNLNGIVDEDDIAILNVAIRRNSNDEFFDLDASQGLVNNTDRDFLIREILETNYGDANLDGRFDSRDLVQVFRAGKYDDKVDHNSSWSEGDWNGDGDFDSSDLVLAFQSGSYVAAAKVVLQPGFQTDGMVTEFDGPHAFSSESRLKNESSACSNRFAQSDRKAKSLAAPIVPAAFRVDWPKEQERLNLRAIELLFQEQDNREIATKHNRPHG